MSKKSYLARYVCVRNSLIFSEKCDYALSGGVRVKCDKMEEKLRYLYTDNDAGEFYKLINDYRVISSDSIYTNIVFINRKRRYH